MLFKVSGIIGIANIVVFNFYGTERLILGPSIAVTRYKFVSKVLFKGTLMQIGKRLDIFALI